jgi:hypothetical protein
VKSGDTVRVTATVSGSTSTATQITDQTTLEANGKSWMPVHPGGPAGGSSSSGTPSSPGTGSGTTASTA